MTVIEAGTADEAAAAAGGHPIDILVTDVNLPDMSGLQLTLKLRETLPDLPVIFATGDRNVPGSEALEQTALITKPYDYRSEEHTSELQSLMRISYAVFCLQKKK